ncbi:thioredoxin-disulfide reductase [Geranomyces variabilis]|nr:thioredoxin-disulfide reductase [Geranomyces variabilis]
MAPVTATTATSAPAVAHHKVVIIGGGPAACTAALYLARANLEPVMFEGFLAAGVAAGGQLTTTTEIENFPGFPGGLSGPELMDAMRAQCEKFGTVIHTETISRVDLSQRPFKLWKEDADEKDEDAILTDSLVIATGATAKRLFIAGEDTFWQAGISACAVCDGAVPIFRNKPLVVVGGGDSASEEATFLTKYASKVYVLVRTNKLRASKVMADRLLAHPKVEVLWNKVPIEAKGDKLLKQLVIEDTVTKERSTLDVNGLFYAIGHTPNSSIFKGQLEVDEVGYLKVRPNNGVPSTYTNIEGVFAAGDIQDRTYRQAITAAGSGCMAALDCERWLESQEKH